MLGTSNNSSNAESSALADVISNPLTANLEEALDLGASTAVEPILLTRHVIKIMANQLIRNLVRHKTKIAKKNWPLQEHKYQVNRVPLAKNIWSSFRKYFRISPEYLNTGWYCICCTKV